MYEFDLGNSKCVASTEPVVSIEGVIFTAMDLVRLKNEVESLREENVALNKDRSALHDTKEKLHKQIKYLEKYSQEDIVIIKFLGKELISREAIIQKLEDENKHLKQTVKDLEEIIRDDMGVQSDEIHNLKTDLDQLEGCYKELLDINHAKHAQVQDQQAVIEFQKSDIERLVKLNAELQNRLDTYKKVLYFSTCSGQ